MNIKEHLYEMRDEHYSQGLEDLILHIQKHSDTKNMTMVEIGSYAGESTIIFAKHFKNVIALSQMTFTHQMVRLIFIEQLYRAFTILANEKYHH